MTLRVILVSTAMATLLAACATQPNNPNYQYSTKYKGSVPTVLASNQTAPAAPVTYVEQRSEHQTQVQPVATSHSPTYATYTRVDELCLQAGTPVRCYPEEFTTGQTKAIIHAPYQTAPDVIFAASEVPKTMTPPVPTETIGTPGYHAVQNIDTEYAYPEAQTQMPMNESVPAVTMPVTIDSDPMSHTGIYRAGKTDSLTEHRIVEGDTVYSMSRQLCISIDDIARINGLDENFSLRLDDVIRLPASRC